MCALSKEQVNLNNWLKLLEVTSTLLITCGAVIVGYGIWRMNQPIFPLAQIHVATSVVVTHNAPLSLSPSEPVHVDIPTISVHAPLAHVGLNTDGSPGVPSGSYVDLPSWLTTSATPGETGTAIIVGHVDTAKSGPSIFYNLGKLTPGSTVSVSRQDGKTAIFTVNAVRIYNKNGFPSTLVYGRSTYAALRLITCTGAWDPLAGRYTQNLVVFASLTAVH